MPSLFAVVYAPVDTLHCSLSVLIVERFHSYMHMQCS